MSGAVTAYAAQAQEPGAPVVVETARPVLGLLQVQRRRAVLASGWQTVAQLDLASAPCVHFAKTGAARLALADPDTAWRIVWARTSLVAASLTPNGWEDDLPAASPAPLTGAQRPAA